MQRACQLGTLDGVTSADRTTKLPSPVVMRLATIVGRASLSHGSCACLTEQLSHAWGLHCSRTRASQLATLHGTLVAGRDYVNESRSEEHFSVRLQAWSAACRGRRRNAPRSKIQGSARMARIVGHRELGCPPGPEVCSIRRMRCTVWPRRAVLVRTSAGFASRNPARARPR